MSIVLEHSAVMVLIAGVCFLMLGLSLGSESLQTLAANQIRKIITKLDKANIMGVLIGALLTILMQSSGALVTTLVNLGTARVLHLPQVMGVLIGGSIGSALTVQLISLHISDAGVPLFVCGFLISFFSKNRRVRESASFLMALGMAFFGIELISLGGSAIAQSKLLGEFLQPLKESAWLSFVISLVLTAIIQSSTATLGIVMGLAASGIMPVEMAIYWVFGSNVGTTAAPVLAALHGNYLGRRIAWANLYYRLATALLFLPFASSTLWLLQQHLESPKSVIAFFYTTMTLFSASIFFPFRTMGVKLIERMVEPDPEEKEFGVRFLKRSNYESTTIALAHAKREILEMGDIVLKMTENSICLLREDNPDLFHETRNYDDRVDKLLREIKTFLIRISEVAPEGLNQSLIDLISFGSDLENAADVIDHGLLQLAKKKSALRLEFSSDGLREIEDMHSMAVRALMMSLSLFQTEEASLLRSLKDLRKEARQLEIRLQESHIGRLSRGVKESIGTSAIHLECIGSYLRILELVTKQADRMSAQTKNSNES